jgi:hypothetical protein
LIVTDIQVVPNPPVVGQPAAIYVTIKNQGTVNVPYGNNFYVDFYVDRVPLPLLLGERYAGIQGSDMTAGSSHTYLMNLSYPNVPNPTYIFSAGSHLLYAQVDTDNSVNECPHENNNIFGPVAISTSGLWQNEADDTPEDRPETGPRWTPTPALSLNGNAAPLTVPLSTPLPTATPTLTPLPAVKP